MIDMIDVQQHAPNTMQNISNDNDALGDRLVHSFDVCISRLHD